MCPWSIKWFINFAPSYWSHCSKRTWTRYVVVFLQYVLRICSMIQENSFLSRGSNLASCCLGGLFPFCWLGVFLLPPVLLIYCQQAHFQNVIQYIKDACPGSVWGIQEGVLFGDRKLGILEPGKPVWWLSGKKSPCNTGNAGLNPGLGRSPGGGNSNSLQYSCLEKPKDRGAWRVKVYGVAKSWT